ncbi:MAG: hypothetical protein IPP31_00100 [Chitinophagaceae bacterium]|nr:hypothetical protein [Chitinophagaceae bacterium]
MKLFITDTNVFFDLMNIEALPEFFGLDFEVCTTDFVVSEVLRLEQAEQIQNFIRSKQLTVFSFSSDEIDEVVNLKNETNAKKNCRQICFVEGITIEMPFADWG